MKYTLRIKPYGENQKGDLITDFSEEEWDLVVDLQERLIRNFKQIYKDVTFRKLNHDGTIITIVFENKKIITEEELEEYIETLCGYNMENVIYFDDQEYYIRGEIILGKNKIDPLEKFNLLTNEVAPELIDK